MTRRIQILSLPAVYSDGNEWPLIVWIDSTHTCPALISEIFAGNGYAIEAGFAFGFCYYSCASFPFSRRDELQEAVFANIQMDLSRPLTEMLPLEFRDLVGRALSALMHTIPIYTSIC